MIGPIWPNYLYRLRGGHKVGIPRWSSLSRYHYILTLNIYYASQSLMAGNPNVCVSLLHFWCTWTALKFVLHSNILLHSFLLSLHTENSPEVLKQVLNFTLFLGINTRLRHFKMHWPLNCTAIKQEYLNLRAARRQQQQQQIQQELCHLNLWKVFRAQVNESDCFAATLGRIF